MLFGLKIAPLGGFCGYLTLATGVEVAVLISLVRACLLLCIVSSQDKLDVGGIVLGPFTQTIIAAVTLFGVPLAILAGLGAIFRIVKDVWLFYYFMALATIIDTIFIVRIVFAGQLCMTVAPPHVLRMGPVFICTFINAAVIFWASIYVVIEVYLTFIVASCAETLEKGEFAELMDAKTMKEIMAKRSYESEDQDVVGDAVGAKTA
eukprot:gnl/TRDRNA2_/TRDRNA2_181548_c0_seq1.p2 gnl/TRDRNA2_/TRDRNA2_181548_c0~~gnl/TRDRNA2_/TRDRNA2_181548_c0_seq1.p2  ORF type:complete len:206 (+),score=55.77 gnl/TRDRNA2_/TRDRNA2_181548_c0_seq1:69-686(+)